MAIVFVHGVNNRYGSAYRAGNLAKEKFLRQHLGKLTIAGRTLPAAPEVRFPYWGNLGAKFAWSMASLPQSEMQTLGTAMDVSVQPLIAHIRDALGSFPPEPLTNLAKKRLSLAVDVLIQITLDSTPPAHEAEIAEFVMQASTYAEVNPYPAWLDSITDDFQFISTLSAQLAPTKEIQALGGMGGVSSAISFGWTKFKQTLVGLSSKAVDRVGDFASTKLLALTRDSLNSVLGHFFGDIFIYLNSRGDFANPGSIPNAIVSAFDDALHNSPSNEPFVVIGHSLGAVIIMDLLSHFRPDIQVDLFISVGSQVAFFEEMKLYKMSNPALSPPNKAKTPANIVHWINIYDEADIFSYTVERVFDRVDVDARYDTQTHFINAHGAYFEQVRFYNHLRERIESL